MNSKPYKRSKKKTAKYYIDYREYLPNGGTRIVQRSTGTRDFQTASEILKKRLSDYVVRKHGILDPRESARASYGKGAFDASFSDFEDSLIANGVDPNYRKNTINQLTRFSKFIKNKPLAEVVLHDATRWNAALLKSGLSTRTVHDHLGSIKRYAKWLSANERILKSPFEALKRKNPKADRVKVRRALSHEEWNAIDATLGASPCRWVPSADRRLLYLLAIRTGLRVGELRVLRLSDFHLNVAQPHVTLSGKHTKNGNDCKQFLGKRLAKKLEADFGDGRAVPFPDQPPLKRWANMIRDDMDYARGVFSGPQPHSGFLDTENFDFHCLRHTCGAWYVSEGTSIKVVQKIMRHSSIQMTLDVYGHLLPGEEKCAIDATEKFF